MTRLHCLRVALCLMLLLSLSPRHTCGATTAPVTVPQTISLDVQGADLQDVLRFLADTGGINILASPEVQGTVTTRLVDVPWEQALEAILRLSGCAQERQGNVILVAPSDRFRSARQERAQARQAEARTEPKVTRVVPVNYARAADLKAALEKFLGACATVAVDGRTNTLILTGTPSCLRVWDGTR